jgi:hypothetical protein
MRTGLPLASNLTPPREAIQRIRSSAAPPDIPSRKRLRQGLTDCFGIFGVQPLENAVHIQSLRLLEAEQLPPLVGRPDYAPLEISNPDAKVGGTGGHAQPLLALAQGLLCQPAAAELDQQRHN